MIGSPDSCPQASCAGGLDHTSSPASWSAHFPAPGNQKARTATLLGSQPLEIKVLPA